MAQRNPSAEKRTRQNQQRYQRNSRLRSALRTAVKKLVVALDSGDVNTAQTELPKAVRALGKAHSKGVIHKNHASRKISRLTRKVNMLVASQS